MSKILTVIGATGTQGSSVVEAALRSSVNWQIRAITRNPSGEAAQVLQAKGVEVVKADLEDLASLKAAFKGSYAIFGVTDFFIPFAMLGTDAQKAKDLEWRHAYNIATAAAECTTLEHFIWSTLPHVAEVSEGKHSVHHFTAKNRAEDYIKAELPALLQKTTFLWVGWYGNNFNYPNFKPTLLETSGKHILVAPAPADTPLFTIGNPSNTGAFALAALEQPEKTLPGRYVDGSIARTSLGGLVKDWSEASGKETVYVQISAEEYDQLWPGWGAAEAPMLQYFDRYRKNAWTREGLLSPSDLGLDTSKLESVAEMLRKMEL